MRQARICDQAFTASFPCFAPDLEIAPLAGVPGQLAQSRSSRLNRTANALAASLPCRQSEVSGERQLSPAQASPSVLSVFEPAVLAEYYKYQRISKSRTVRLLRLEPGTSYQSLEGHLIDYKIGGGKGYNAISYVWDSPSLTSTISIEGKRLAITASVSAALKHFRRKKGRKLVWIDQICINQKDIVERSQQVQLMHTIYKDASNVLVWLGEDSKGRGRKAFQLCRSLNSIANDTLLYSLYKKAGSDFDWIPKDYWVSLRELTLLPWFRRVWIPQEIGTETPAQIHWGDSWIDWESMSEAMHVLKDLWELRRFYQIDPMPIAVLHKRFVKPPEPDIAQNEFVYQLILSSRNFATDPRDFIFSQLGHYTARVNSEIETIIEADYDNTVETIFHEVAIRVLKTSTHLLLLNAATHQETEDARKTLPSWVPRWDEIRALGLIGYPGRFAASQGRKLESKFEKRYQHLVLDGIEVDEITGVDFCPHLSNIDTMYGAWKLATSAFLDHSKTEKFSTVPKYRHKPLDALEVFLDVFAPAKSIGDVSKTANAYESGLAALQELSGGNQDEYLGKTCRQMSINLKSSKVRPSLWMELASQHASGRTLVITKQGYIAMAPPTTVVGDQLCILFGGETPYVLRHYPTKKNISTTYRFLGEAYVPGLMDGEAISELQTGGSRQKVFTIR